MFFPGLGEGGVFYCVWWSNSFQSITELLIDSADAKKKAATNSTKLQELEHFGILRFLLLKEGKRQGLSP